MGRLPIRKQGEPSEWPGEGGSLRDGSPTTCCDKIFNLPLGGRRPVATRGGARSIYPPTSSGRAQPHRRGQASAGVAPDRLVGAGLIWRTLRGHLRTRANGSRRLAVPDLHPVDIDLPRSTGPKRTPKALAEACTQRGQVEVAGGASVGIERLDIDDRPDAVVSLGRVRRHDVSVEMGITGVKSGARKRQGRRPHLLQAAGTGARQQRPTLEILDDLTDRLLDSALTGNAASAVFSSSWR
jgi:hypothetical protein